ncbi:hypothetical protein BB558_005315 [Smittium angustum]|uniref:G-protein coupled receptors family 1 profile domain-containing protein n=1 Tax=Smittium angustum TaxID=133377 RepID=A0A2U1J0W7_SMIAN|nr:hypothetical protein BB558_005315 [Smittium angustum]
MNELEIGYILTIGLSSVTIAVYLWFRITRKSLVNRVSLRLTTLVSLVNVFSSIVRVVPFYVNVNETLLCRFFAPILYFSQIFTTLLLASTAVNLHIVFVIRKSRASYKKLEMYYVLVSFFVALVIVVIESIVSVRAKVCWVDTIRHGNSSKILGILWASLYIWIFVPSAYSLVIVVVVLVKIFKEQKKIKQAFKKSSFESTVALQMGSKNMNSGNRRIKHKSAKMFLSSANNVYSAVLRIVMYPIVPIVLTTFAITIGHLLNNLSTKLNFEKYPTVIKVNAVFYAYSGLLNVLAFCFDPAFQPSFKHLFIYKSQILFRGVINNLDPGSFNQKKKQQDRHLKAKEIGLTWIDETINIDKNEDMLEFDNEFENSEFEGFGANSSNSDEDYERELETTFLKKYNKIRQDLEDDQKPQNTLWYL